MIDMNEIDPKKAEMEMLSLNVALDRIKREKHALQNIIVEKSQACCPDVCKTIDQINTLIEDEIEKISFTEKANIKRIRTFPKEFRESLLNKNKLRSEKAISLLEIRTKELTELKKTLSDNNKM